MHLIVESIAFSIPKFQLYMCSSLNIYLHAVLLLFLSCLLLPQPTLGTDMAGTPNFTANVAAITNSSFFIANRGCQLTCGGITVPYPFGFGKSHCYHSWLKLTCDTSSDPPKLHLGNSNIVVSSISQTQVRVRNPVAVQCYNQTGATIDELTEPGWMRLGKGRTFSDTANKFTVVGCNVYALISWWNEDRDFSTGCLAVCSSNGEVLPGKCTGIGKSHCYHSWLNLTCDTSSDPPKLHLGGLEVISISQTQVRVRNTVAVRCYDETGATIDELSDLQGWMSLGKGRTFSDTANKFTVVGCNVYAWIKWSNEDGEFSTGCSTSPECSRNGSVLPGKCTGFGCCQIDIPKGFTIFNNTYSLHRVNLAIEIEVWILFPFRYSDRNVAQ